MLSGMPVVFIAKALLRSWNIVATLLAYNVEYYFTTIAVAFRLATCLCNKSCDAIVLLLRRRLLIFNIINRNVESAEM